MHTTENPKMGKPKVAIWEFIVLMGKADKKVKVFQICRHGIEVVGA